MTTKPTPAYQFIMDFHLSQLKASEALLELVDEMYYFESVAYLLDLDFVGKALCRCGTITHLVSDENPIKAIFEHTTSSRPTPKDIALLLKAVIKKMIALLEAHATITDSKNHDVFIKTFYSTLEEALLWITLLRSGLTHTPAFGCWPYTLAPEEDVTYVMVYELEPTKFSATVKIGTKALQPTTPTHPKETS